MAFSVTAPNGREQTAPRPLHEFFKRDYYLTMDRLRELAAEGQEVGPLLEAFGKVVGPKGKILKVENARPHSRVSFAFLLKNRLKPEAGFAIETGYGTTIDEDEEVTFKKFKHFVLLDGRGTTLRCTIERLSREELEEMERTAAAESRPPYRTTLTLDSEEETEMPECVNAKYYSRNGLLGSANCGFIRRRALSKHGKCRPPGPGPASGKGPEGQWEG